MTAYNPLKTRQPTEPHSWLITGVAGFIGSFSAKDQEGRALQDAQTF